MTVAPTNPPLANLDEYADPDHYDQENPAFEPDGPFYQELAQRLGGTVLELGCGTGRLTIPLARAGIAITGIDAVPAMLAHARQKAGALPIRWVEADARGLALSATFELILDTGEVLQHALTRTEHEAILAHVREHLAPQGHFVTSALLPRAGLITDQDEHPWFDYADAQGRHVQVSGTVRYDPLGQVYHEDAIRRWREADGREVTRLAPLARRLFFPQELEALLHYNGFAVVERYGDWDGAALERESPRLIFVCARNG
jgi:2-polyprenyl-3-methyl-5-hydroxy-6-metoxy-1,4-benzoquinol methylase